jgi:FAD/FMN-containing dehydrogenase
MAYITKTFYSFEDLIGHIKAHQPSFYFSSKTSTVIPYDKLESLLPWEKDTYYLCDLSKLPPHMELKSNGNLILRGSVSWEDAKKFLRSKGRNLKTSPTEQLALITAGIATSCTGERCFGFGNMRSQVVSLKYLDFNGDEKELKREQDFKTNSPLLKPYQQDFNAYKSFKNAPYPRFEKAIDLMIGTEGQMGIVSEVEIETVENFDLTYVFMLLPRWEDNYEPHMEIFHAVQNQREAILSCELLDSNCMNYLKPDEKLGQDQDVIFLEVKSDRFEEIYSNLLCHLKHISADDVFEIAENKFHHVRAGVPRAIFEENSKMGVVKVGTDCQVAGDRFPELIKFYREASKIGVRYCLFGHFGDAHLHYNYMPSKDQTPQCLKKFEQLYDHVYEWKGSPFAEHGIGLIKQKYIKKFQGPNQIHLFQDLKKEHDPFNQFFPQGFMNATKPH